MVSNYYINLLASKAKKDMNARWRLGELLHEAIKNGHEVIQDRETGIIEIKTKKDVSF